jgi:hypothetical protein
LALDAQQLRIFMGEKKKLRHPVVTDAEEGQRAA